MEVSCRRNSVPEALVSNRIMHTIVYPTLSLLTTHYSLDKSSSINGTGHLSFVFCYDTSCFIVSCLYL